MRRLQWADFVNRYVILLFAVQVIGWVVLGAAFDHDPSPFISWVQELPSGIKQALTPFVILAIPAILLNVIIGVSLELLAVRVPAPVPSMTFFINAYLLAVVGAWGITRHRTIVPEERVLVAPTAVESSRWWYWIAAYVLYVGVVFSATTLATFAGLLPPVRFRSVMGGLFVLVGIGVFVLAVAAVYVDGPVSTGLTVPGGQRTAGIFSESSSGPSSTPWVRSSPRTTSTSDIDTSGARNRYRIWVRFDSIRLGPLVTHHIEALPGIGVLLRFVAGSIALSQ